MPAPASRPPIICIPGLTRNARDFEGVAERLAGEWRVICVELRGRGESAYAKDPMTYVPLDLSAGHGGADRRAEAGALRPVRHLARRPHHHAARGERQGPDRRARCSTISGRCWRRAGSTISAPMSAARATGRPGSTPRASSPRRRPTAIRDWTLDQWLVYAKRLCKLTPAGRIVLDYDMRIAEPFKRAGRRDRLRPVAGLRGARRHPVAGRPRRDLRPLTAETVERMKAEMPGLESVTVPRRRPCADARRAGGGRGDRPAAEAGRQISQDIVPFLPAG